MAEEKWVIGEIATGIEHGQTVYVRLWNGTKGGQYIQKKIIDGISPAVIVRITNIGTNIITASAEAGDNQSGLPNSPIYTFSIKEKNVSDSVYKIEQSNSSRTCNFANLKQNTEYTVKVTVRDNAGNIGEGTIDGKTENVIISQEGNINISEPIWDSNTHTASVTLSKGAEIDTNLKIQYQINDYRDDSWIEGITVAGIQHNQTVYARLIDTTGQANGYASWKIVDSIDPTAEISLDKAEITTDEIAIATVRLIDNQSGIDLSSCKWELSTESVLGTDDVSRYTNSFDVSKGENQEISISSTEAGTYYLHVLVQDNAGRKVEKTLTENVIIKASGMKMSEIAEPGDYVQYDSGSEYEGLWRVLYNHQNYGLQIISDDCVEQRTLGECDDSLGAAWAYNNSVGTLNSVCFNYFNEKYALQYRSVGSHVGFLGTYRKGDIYDDKNVCRYWTVYLPDTYYQDDIDAMTNATKYDNNGILTVESGDYWLASRGKATYSNEARVGLWCVKTTGSRSLVALSINSSGTTGLKRNIKQTYGLRPVIKLKADILTDDGDGSLEKPFKLVPIEN